MYSEEAHKGNFIGAGWFDDTNLSNKLGDNWRDFNSKFIPIYLKSYPDKSKVSAGLACGMLWTITKGIQANDIVLCPDGRGNYYVGEVIGDYEYKEGQILPHRRAVRWFSKPIRREDMSEPLKKSAGSIGTVSDISKYADEIEDLLSGNRSTIIISTDKDVEDPSVFALEEHLEDFLVKNWRSTELGKDYDIYEEDGEIVGRQYPSDTGPIDILAISKNKKELLLVELKRGRASDVVVGQIQRYMGMSWLKRIRLCTE
jgi:restriction system protein